MLSQIKLHTLPAIKHLLTTLLLATLLLLGALAALPGVQRLSSFVVQAAPGEVYCVTPDTGGTFTVCDAVFANVQAAIDAASGGEEIWVAAGIYTDVHHIVGVAQTVYLTKTVDLRGGYNADFTAWDPDSFETTLDAQGQGRVFFLSGDISSTIEGFTITGGDATGLGAGSLTYLDAGGGFYIDGVTITLSHNRIQDNLATNGLVSTREGFGGGLYAISSTIHMTDNTVYQNRAVISPAGPYGIGSAGGLHFERSEIELINNSVLSNTATITGDLLFSVYGGGITIYASEALLEGNLIEGNVAAEFADFSYGGGLYLEDNAAVTLTNNQIRHNVANKFGTVGFGGGILNYNQYYPTSQNVGDGLGSNNSRPSIGKDIAGLYSAIDTVEAQQDSSLAPIATSLILLDNLIEYNLAGENAAGIGGGVYLSSAGIPLDIRLERNRILSNTSKLQADDIGPGGGLVIANSKVMMDGDIFQNNEARSLIGIGGGMYLYDSEAWLTNTVFLANRASEGGAGLMVEGGSSVQVHHATFTQQDTSSSVYLFRDTVVSPPQLPGSVSMTNVIIANSPLAVQVYDENTVNIDHVLWYQVSNIFSTSLPIAVTITNQITANPQFAADGYHLTAGSAARGQGIWAGVSHDIDGHPRHASPDLGSDEYWDVLPTPRSYLPLIHK